jgi:hypothetical protein
MSTPVAERVVFRSAARRLTRSEIRQTVIDLVGVDFAEEVSRFPATYPEGNVVFAFDNDYTLQEPSTALVEAAKSLAEAVAARLASDAALRARLVPCTPSGPGDEACLRRFVSSFGRRALRRSLTADEVTRYATKLRPLSMEAGDFFRGVGLAVRALLQDVEFLYRVEIGRPVPGSPGLLRLTGPEVASRLSYFLWGAPPDEALLDAAEGGEALQTPQAVRAAATRLLGAPRAKQGVAKFHSMWLGWERFTPEPPLGRQMLAESEALLERVILKERGSWLGLFRAQETFVDRALAAHYGLPAPASGSAWVGYGATGRQGILSHGAFLGVERKHKDTSPTMRGLFVRTRVMCEEVPPPPDNLEIDIDNPPTEGDCKIDRYSASLKNPTCAFCHQKMDPIGFGLENFDRAGKYRTLAPDDARKPQCQITGEGELSSVGPFKGVAGLADRLVASKALEGCVPRQLGHFLLGRTLAAEEERLFVALGKRFEASGHRFDALLLDVVGLEGFAYRVAE